MDLEGDTSRMTLELNGAWTLVAGLATILIGRALNRFVQANRQQVDLMRACRSECVGSVKCPYPSFPTGD